MTDESSKPAPDSTELSANDREMIASVPADDVDDTEKPEFELTPEAEERIMAMIKDIANGDTPYTSVSSLPDVARLKLIFTQGLLGVPLGKNWQKYYDSQKEKGRVETWRKFTRRDRNTVVNFNMNYPNDTGDPMSRMSEDSIALTFDLTNYRDTSEEYALNLPDEALGRGSSAPTKHKTFRTNDPGDLFAIKMRGVAHNKHYPSLDFGFVLAHRLPPREFDGVMIPTAADPKEFVSAITAIYSELNGQIVLPIYNKAGDLLWPQQITHEEVMKYIEERDKEKQSEENSEK